MSGRECKKNDTNFRKAIPLEKRVAIALWRLANGNSYRTIAKTFAVGKSTSVKITKEFCQTVSLYAPRYINFPKTRRETTEAIIRFREDYNCIIPQALGAIDATHIPIIAPAGESKPDYFSRKQHYSINTQCIVGDNLKFIDVTTGAPGSIHDSRVLRNSSIFNDAEGNRILTTPIQRIQNLDVKPLLLGDGGYPLTAWLLKPYSINLNLSRAQKKFNRELSSSRSSAERAFGILKARWRCLIKRLDTQLENIPQVIVTCCVLHNLCQSNNDIYDDEDDLLTEILRHERADRLLRAQRGNWPNFPEAEHLRTVIKDYVFEQ